MDCLAAGHDGRRKDRRRRQVTAPRLGRADTDRFVSQLHGARVAVSFAVSDHGVDAERMAGTHDAHGDLATVGNQDAAEHQALTSASTLMAVSGRADRFSSLAKRSPY